MRNKIIGDKIRKLRKSKNITEKEMAEAIGITQRSLYAYELGDRVPRDEIKIKIAKYFGTSVESIFFTN